MRIAGLFALAFLLPAFAHAAGSPTLKTYTISHDTIYPTATAGSGLATTTTIDIAFFEQVQKASIKIVSTNSTVVKLLYLSSGAVTNPNPRVWDGKNDAGVQVNNGTYTILISATSTAPDNLAMVDSSKTITVASSSGSPPPDDSSDTADVTTETTVNTSSGGGPSEYLPIPTLRIVTNGNRTVSSGADIVFTATVYDNKGNKRDDAVVAWSFGDGMRRTGASVYHAYYDPGEYLAVVHATTSDGGDTQNEILMTVKDASIKIMSVSPRGIALTNNDSRTLNVSLWRLSMGGQEFKIPEDTQILAGRTVLFPSQVIELPIANSASLLYPSGEIAATYPETITATVPSAQPFTSRTSFNKVQTVEPITSKQANIQTYDEAVSAPTATTELAAVGAALPPVSSNNSRSAGIFKSPWTLGFLGVLALAGSVFIFL